MKISVFFYIYGMVIYILSGLIALRQNSYQTPIMIIDPLEINNANNKNTEAFGPLERISYH
jgi:hypothetical protein